MILICRFPGTPIGGAVVKTLTFSEGLKQVTVNVKTWSMGVFVCVLFSIQWVGEGAAGWPLISVLPLDNYKTLINLDIDFGVPDQMSGGGRWDEADKKNNMEAFHLQVYGGFCKLCQLVNTIRKYSSHLNSPHQRQ